MTRSKPITFLATAAVIPLTALAVASCGGGASNDANSSSAPPTAANGRPATLGVENNSLGKILDDTHGRTLYLFKKDSGTKSACSGIGRLCCRTGGHRRPGHRRRSGRRCRGADLRSRLSRRAGRPSWWTFPERVARY